MIKKPAEQRIYPRFEVRTGVSAALGETKIGTIANISRGGLALSCFDCNDHDTDGRQGSQELSIFHEDGFLLEHIPCKILGECFPAQKAFGSSINQCHIQFNVLTRKQRSQLEDFLNYFTDKPITSQ